MASRVNLGMGGPQKKSPAKKSTVKRKTNGQGVKMKSKGGAMGGKKDIPPGMQYGGMAEKADKKKMKKKPKGMKMGGKVKSKGYRMGGKVKPKGMKSGGVIQGTPASQVKGTKFKGVF